MTPDQHLGDYLSSMRRSMGDKTFFIPMLPRDVTTIADFGCADGSLLARAYTDMAWDRKPSLLGYDHDERMVDLAKQRLGASLAFGPGNATSSYPMFRRALQEDRRKGRKVCLVFSSVLHEWLGDHTHGDLVDLIEELDPEFVAIRDMATVRTGRNNDRAVLQAYLKSAYPENAEEEQSEDYFALSPMDLIMALPGYTLRHFSLHLPPYIRRGVNERHGVWLDEPTHVTILLARR